MVAVDALIRAPYWTTMFLSVGEAPSLGGGLPRKFFMILNKFYTKQHYVVKMKFQQNS